MECQITLYDPRSKGAKSYEKFTREFLKINEEESKSCKAYEERRIEYGKKNWLRKRIGALFSDSIKEPEIEEVTGEIVQILKLLKLNQIKNNLEKDLMRKS